jgi:hypothetical protein
MSWMHDIAVLDAADAKERPTCSDLQAALAGLKPTRGQLSNLASPPLRLMPRAIKKDQLLLPIDLCFFAQETLKHIQISAGRAL